MNFRDFTLFSWQNSSSYWMVPRPRRSHPPTSILNNKRTTLNQLDQPFLERAIHKATSNTNHSLHLLDQLLFFSLHFSSLVLEAKIQLVSEQEDRVLFELIQIYLAV